MIFTQELEEKYPTLFGFNTNNKTAANGLNTIYGIVMIVAMAFAYHALGLILVGWSSFLIFLAAISVVGLPYCIKIIMYGRKSFTLNMAILCIAISMLPTIFDFIGFYSETSIRQSLVNTKFEVLEKLNYFDKEARTVINNSIIKLNEEYNVALTKTDQDFNSRISSLSKEVIDAEQTYMDETEGVSGRITTGKVGMGPKAKELESEIRKTEANVSLKKKELETNKQKEVERLNKDYETKLSSYQKGLESINSLVSSEDNKGLIFNVNKAKTYDELADTVIKLNSAVNTVSSKLDVEPQYVKFSTENVIQLSFGSLFRGEITAIICFSLALLLEIVDTIIVYMVRGIKKKPENTNKNKENLESPIRERTVYSWKTQEKENVISQVETDKENINHQNPIWIYNK